jgi:hypothetical protein
MPINIKNNGSWSNGTPFIKTSNSWTSAKQVFAKVNGTWQTVYTSSISDNFDRANSASLGNVPDTDFTWTQTDGSWSINTNRVESATSPASYPMIDVDFNTQNVAIGANINATGTSQASGKYGAGIAFWIVDATNWWAAYNDVVLTGTTTFTCASTFNGKPLQSGQGTATCVYDYAATATSTPGATYCPGGSVGPRDLRSVSNVTSANCTVGYVASNVCITATRNGGYPTNIGPCGPGGSSANNTPCPSGTVAWDGYGNCYSGTQNVQPTTDPPTTTYSCPSGGTLSGTTCLLSNAATTGTTYSYSQKIKLINSVNNSVATINTYTVNDNTWIPANISVSTSGNTVTLRAYANDDNTGSSWIQTYTATSPNRGTRQGLMLGPRGDSLVSQATSLDNFTLSAV